MSPKRYFENPYDDYDPTSAETNFEFYSDEKAQQRITTLLRAIDQGKRSVCGQSDAGLYLGPAGVAYAFWRVHQSGITEGDPLSKARELLNYNLKYLKACNAEFDTKKDKLGFLIGQAGVFATGAVIGRDGGDDALRDQCLAAFKDIAPLAVEGVNGSDELLVGRAGYISGAIWLKQQFGTDVVPN